MQTLEGNLKLKGTFSPDGMNYPPDQLDDSAISPFADIDPTKMRHQYIFTSRQATGTDVATKTEDVCTAFAAGSLVGVQVTTTTKATGTSIGTDKKFTVDVQKGNQSTGFATVLTAVVTIDQTIANRQVVTATISGTVTHAAGDTYRVIVTASGSTGTQAQGLIVSLITREAAE